MTNHDLFFPQSQIYLNSFGLSGPIVARICWNFEGYQYFILIGPGGNHAKQNLLYPQL